MAEQTERDDPETQTDDESPQPQDSSPEPQTKQEASEDSAPDELDTTKDADEAEDEDEADEGKDEVDEGKDEAEDEASDDPIDELLSQDEASLIPEETVDRHRPGEFRRIIVLGINERIQTLLQLLQQENTEILLIAADISNFEKVLDEAQVRVIVGDFLDPELLHEADLHTASSVIILADIQHHSPQDADARSVVATLSVEQINPAVKTVVEVFSDETAFHLHNAGVDEIIQSGELTADILAYSTTHPHYSDHLGTLLRFTYQNNVITAPVSERLAGKTIRDVTQIMAGKRQVLLGIRIAGSRKRETLDPDYALGDKDEMVYIDIL